MTGYEKRWYVARDGEIVSDYLIDENACWTWLLKHQGMSVDWALKYEGYSFEQLKDDAPQS